MKIILSDFEAHLRFAPLSLTRPIGDIRLGLFTNLERWSILLPDDHIGFKSESYLRDEFEELNDGKIVNACIIPNEDFVASIVYLEDNCRLMLGNNTMAISGTGKNIINYKGEIPILINNRWELLSANASAISNDIALIKESISYQKIPKDVIVIGPKDSI